MPKLVLWFVCLSFVLAACSQQPKTFADLPSGDAQRGEALFTQRINGAPSCSSCHYTTDETLVGPGLAGLAERAANRITGQSATDYLFMSITKPASYIVEDFGNLMYTQYQTRLDDQHIADLIAYLLTLE